MQLGFVSAIVPEYTLEQTLALASDIGYSAVELMCWPVGKAERRFAGVTHVDVTHWARAHAVDVRRRLDSGGIAVTALGYYPNLLTPDAEEADRCLAHLRKVIEAAADLHIGRVNTFIGADWRLSVDANWPRMLEVWRPLVAFAAERHVRIGIENCPMLFTADEWPSGKNLARSPAVWRRLFADIPSDYLGLNYDPSHLLWQMMDPYLPIAEFASRLFHIHAKDARIDRARLDEHGILATPLTYHQPVIPGRGGIDWPRFIAELRRANYRGPVCVEVEDDTFGRDLPGRLQALRSAHEFLAPILGAASSPMESHR